MSGVPLLRTGRGDSPGTWPAFDFLRGGLDASCGDAKGLSSWEYFEINSCLYFHIKKIWNETRNPPLQAWLIDRMTFPNTRSVILHFVHNLFHSWYYKSEVPKIQLKPHGYMNHLENKLSSGSSWNPKNTILWFWRSPKNWNLLCQV